MARVLIVDDEIPILTVLRVLVTSLGHEVVACQDPVEAMRYIDSDEHFDLVLSDLRMNPVSGMDILKTVKQRRPQLPVIIISAYLSDEQWQEAKTLGAVSGFLKPFRAEELRDRISAVLSNTSAKD